MDDLLDNPFDFQEPLLPKEMQTENNEASECVKLIDRLSVKKEKKHTTCRPNSSWQLRSNYHVRCKRTGRAITILSSDARSCPKKGYWSSWRCVEGFDEPAFRN